MAKGRIEVTIRPDGTIETDAHGYKGKSCEEATEELLRDVGTIEDEGDKPDKWLPDPSKQTVQQKEE